MAGTPVRSTPPPSDGEVHVAPQTHLLVWLTSVTDRRDHAVTDDEMDAGCAAGHGEFLAVCGRTVRVGSLYDPPCPPCTGCQQASEPRKRHKPRHALNRSGQTR